MNTAASTNQTNTPKNRRLLRLPQVLELIPVSKSTWWNGVKKGRFPKPVKPTERTSAWWERDIHALADSFADDQG